MVMWGMQEKHPFAVPIYPLFFTFTMIWSQNGVNLVEVSKSEKTEQSNRSADKNKSSGAFVS